MEEQKKSDETGKEGEPDHRKAHFIRTTTAHPSRTISKGCEDKHASSPIGSSNVCFSSGSFGVDGDRLRKFHEIR